MTGQVCSGQVVIAASSRSAARRVGTCQLEAKPVQKVVHAPRGVGDTELSGDQLGDAGACPALIEVAVRGWTGVQCCFQRPQLDLIELAGRPAGALGGQRVQSAVLEGAVPAVG